MSQTPVQISREKELVAKYVANVVNATLPALTPAERSELAELLEVTI